MKKDTQRWWSYQAISPSGQRYRGRCLATSSTCLTRRLQQEGGQLISCRRLLPFWDFQKISSQDQEFLDFSYHMGALLAAGFSLEDALEAYDGSSRFHSLKIALLGDIRAGSSLAQAFERHISSSDHFVMAFINVSEKRGDLAEGFKRVSSYLGDKRKFRKTLISSLSYPCFLFMLVLLLMAFLLTEVIPELDSFLVSMGVTLSPSSRLLVSLAQGFRSILFPFILCIIVGAGSITVAAFLSSTFTIYCQNFLVKVPFLGSFILERERLLFLENLGLLLASGIPLVEALELSQEGNRLFFQRKLQIAMKDIVAGQRLYQAFGKQALFDRRALRFIRTGESSGHLVSLLKDLCSLSQRDLQHKRDRFLGSLEPATLCFVGALLIWIVMAFFLPLYESLGGECF